MGYFFYAGGVYAGLWMRKYDQDTGRITEMVYNARKMRGDVYDCFTGVFFNWKKTDLPEGMISVSEANLIQKTVGTWFDKLTLSLLIDGLYLSDSFNTDIKLVVLNDETKQKK